jgi:sigma-54 specific flagellar transcriptional regulator A
MPPKILIIDNNGQRASEIKVVLQFLEYAVDIVDVDKYTNDLKNKYNAVFFGGVFDFTSSLFQDMRIGADTLQIAIFILANKGENNSSVPVGFHEIEWPSTHSVLTGVLNKLKTDEEKYSLTNGLTGNSDLITATKKLIVQVAKTDASVLILGESGTGKEVVAQSLHQLSNRSREPFVPVNCGAIPAELIESELFGHEKGAFTGALTARQGRFEMAEGGTLFLDEIGDMPLSMQVKLLRVLQEKTFERVGSNKTIKCNVRIIAATHRNLEDEIANNKFREDLYYRLNVFPIEVPSLRDRIEDLPYLINNLVKRLEQTNRGSVSFTHEAIGKLMQHPWSGNIRELSNLIERMSIIKPHGVVDSFDLPPKFHSYTEPEVLKFTAAEEQEIVKKDISSAENAFLMPSSTPIIIPKGKLPIEGIDLKEYLTELESNLIKQALDNCNGVVAHAALLLNMRRTTLVEKLRKA